MKILVLIALAGFLTACEVTPAPGLVTYSAPATPYLEQSSTYFDVLETQSDLVHWINGFYVRHRSTGMCFLLFQRTEGLTSQQVRCP